MYRVCRLCHCNNLPPSHLAIYAVDPICLSSFQTEKAPAGGAPIWDVTDHPAWRPPAGAPIVAASLAMSVPDDPPVEAPVASSTPSRRQFGLSPGRPQMQSVRWSLLKQRTFGSDTIEVMVVFDDEIAARIGLLETITVSSVPERVRRADDRRHQGFRRRHRRGAEVVRGSGTQVCLRQLPILLWRIARPSVWDVVTGECRLCYPSGQLRPRCNGLLSITEDGLAVSHLIDPR